MSSAITFGDHFVVYGNQNVIDFLSVILIFTIKQIKHSNFYATLDNTFNTVEMSAQ